MKKITLQRNLTGYSFILPSMILLLVFVVIPLVGVFYYGFTDFNGLKAPNWVGIKNYINIFKDVRFVTALKNTLRYMIVSVPIKTVLSLAVAALLAANLRNKFGEFVRGSVYIPVLCSAALVGSIFKYFFASDAGSMANVILSWFGIDKVNWLGMPNIAPYVLIAISVWKGFGYFTILLYAGIMDVPINLYEAADIDGANKWQQFWHITLPNIKPILAMLITIGIIWSIQFFDLAYVMTSGGPADSNMSIVYMIYTKAFKDFKFGYASALSVILFFVMLIINIIKSMLTKED